MNSKLPDITTHFPEWYQEVIYQAELADQSPVRGCIIIRPYGTEIWESIKGILDKKIKDTGHKNAIFPLLIPESFIKKEADHIEGFAPELAIVTHAGGKELAEPLVIRPTSETMIHHTFAQWIRSWRDLPLKINQWANVMRWEMRPRAFLRTSEFFWQEGHTAHSSQEEALEEALLMLDQYKDLAENYLAIPVITGKKSEGEKFPGADATYTFEAFMPDAKALQMGTSHMLSQNFAKSFAMTYQNQEGAVCYPWLTSWGATTRLIGAMVMTHGDQKGLVLPPKIAPIQVVIIPIYKTDEQKDAVLTFVYDLAHALKEHIRIVVDADDTKKPGHKFFHWELKGVPLRLEIGPRDIENNVAIVAHRLLGTKETISLENIQNTLLTLLNEFQTQLFNKAQKRLHSMKTKAATLEAIITAGDNHFVQTGYCGAQACEKLLKPHKLSIRCIISETTQEFCFGCKSKNKADAIIARSY